MRALARDHLPRYPRKEMLARIVQETVDAFLSRLRGRYGSRVVDVRLFGSQARGEAREDSDVDVLVLLDHVEPDDDRAITDMASDLIWELHGVVIEPLVMSADEFARWLASERRTPCEIEKDGIRL